MNVQVHKGRREAECTQEPVPKSARWAAWGQEVSDKDGNLDWCHITGGQRAFTGLGLDFVWIKDPVNCLSQAMSWPSMCCSRKVILGAAYSHNLKTGSWRQGMIWCDGQKAMNGASPVAQMAKTLPAIQETQVWFLGQEDPPGGGNDNLFQSQHERGESKKALSGREDT